MMLMFFVSTRPIFKKMDIPSRDQENVTSEQTSDTLEFGFRVKVVLYNCTKPGFWWRFNNKETLANF